MVDNLKCYLDGLFASLPLTEEVAEIKNRLYHSMKQQYEAFIQQGVDPQTAYENVISGIGDLMILISQLKKEENHPPKNEENYRQFSKEGPLNKVNEFVHTVTDFTSGLINGMLIGSDPTDLRLVNRITVPLAGIENIKISYLAESISLIQSTNENLEIHEYMNQKDPELFAVIEQIDGRVQVKHGRRKGLLLKSRVEVCLPANWHGAISLSTIYGQIVTHSDWNFFSFNAKSLNGSIEMTNLDAKTVKLSSSLGSLILESCSGQMDFNTVSGEIRVKKLSGGGVFGTIAGNMQLYLEKIDHPIKLASENGEIRLRLSKELNFEFDAVSISGTVFSSFSSIENTSGNFPSNKSVGSTLQEYAAMRINPSQNRAHGYVGTSPYDDIEISTSTGNIYISG